MKLLRGVTGIGLVAAAYSTAALLGNDKVDVPLTIGCAAVLGVVTVFVARHLRVSARAHLAVWFSLLFLNFTSVAIEGTLFAPALAPPSGLALNLLRLGAASAAVALVIAGLFHHPKASIAIQVSQRSPLGWSWRIVALAAVYVAVYLVLGGLNYTFVTHPYYEAHAGSVTVPPPAAIFAYEPFRGFLIALSLLPLTLALGGRGYGTASIALIAGLMLFVVGGLVPLLPQNSLPLYLRVASLWEIFGQNFVTGAASGYLFIGTRPTRQLLAG